MYEVTEGRSMIKLCGMRRTDDVRIINEFLPDYMGMILTQGFMRTVDIDTAKQITDMADLKTLVTRGKIAGVYDKNEDCILIVQFESGMAYRLLSSQDTKI